MKIKLSCYCAFLLLFIYTGLCNRISAQPEFNFLGGFSYVINTPLNEVFDVTPDGRRSAVLTPSEPDPIVGSQVTIIDPVTGVRLDSKITGKGQIAIKFVVLNDGIKVVALTDDFGNKYITIYDMNENGLLTQRAYTQLNNNPGILIAGSNLILSPATRTGFVSLSSGNIRLVSFSLDTGNVLNTIVTPVSEYLNFYEDSTRRLLVGGSSQTLVFIDYGNPAQLQELGRVTLPSTGAFFGTYQLSTVFSSDGQYVFAGNGYSKLTAINTATRQIVGSLSSSNYRARQLKIYENGGNRFLVLRSLEDGSGVLKGFAIINANDPANLTVVNEIGFGEQIFSQRDFAISRNGRRLFIASFAKLTAYSIPDLSQIWEIPLPSVFDAVKVVTFGQRERILGAWLNKIYSIPNFTNRISNFDLDGKTNIGVFRPANGTWYWLQSTTNSFRAAQFGADGDVPVSADYDGDEKTDLAVFRRSSGIWYILESSTNNVRTVSFGLSSDELVAGDYDGDGKTDIAVFKRNPNRWLIFQSSNGAIKTQKFGFGRGKPIVGDYNDDGKNDFAFFNSTGVWQILDSNGAVVNQQFGLPGDIPISGDFDNDGRSDLAVFRPSNRTWYIQQSFSGFRAIQFGLSTDKLIPADYDGDGKTDIAVFRPSNGTWYILQSSNNFVRSVQFGSATDIPTTLQN